MSFLGWGWAKWAMGVGLALATIAGVNRVPQVRNMIIRRA